MHEHFNGFHKVCIHKESWQKLENWTNPIDADVMLLYMLPLSRY